MNRQSDPNSLVLGAATADLRAAKLSNSMSVMFETRFPRHPTSFAAAEPPLQERYIDCCWDLEQRFDGKQGVK